MLLSRQLTASPGFASGQTISRSLIDRCSQLYEGFCSYFSFCRVRYSKSEVMASFNC